MAACAAFLWISCTGEQEDIIDGITIPVPDLEVNAQAEALSDQIDDIVASVVFDDAAAAKSETQNRIEVPACMSVTKTTSGNQVTKVIDFGEGCQLANGVTYGGQIYVVYTWDNELRQANIVVETENLKVNDLMIAGRKEIVRSWPAEGTDGAPNSVVETNLTVSHSSGLNAVVTGVTTREWIAGFGSGTWGDNVVLIGGNRSVTTYLNDREIASYQMEITDKLRREWACRFIVSGVLKVSKSDFSCTLNYGEGQCDSKAVITTSGGRSKEIQLR